MQTPLELPHTRGCLVCGKSNPHGLKLALFVDRESGGVRVEYTPRPEHIGFEGIVHGGALATVFDEAMVWAATWANKRFCVCAEMTVRYQRVAKIGELLSIRAVVTSARSRLIVTSAEARDSDGQIVAEASGKYVPVSQEQNAEFMKTFVDEPATIQSRAMLLQGP